MASTFSREPIFEGATVCVRKGHSHITRLVVLILPECRRATEGTKNFSNYIQHLLKYVTESFMLIDFELVDITRLFFFTYNLVTTRRTPNST